MSTAKRQNLDLDNTNTSLELALRYSSQAPTWTNLLIMIYCLEPSSFLANQTGKITTILCTTTQLRNINQYKQ
ncbi:hypothetical protein VITU102760_24640 [Vibrio tubiashii]